LNIINTFFEITIIKSFRKKEKKIKKKQFALLFENLIVTSKVIRRRQQRSIDRKDKLKQGESEAAPNIQEATASNTIRVSSAILKDQVTSFIIYFTNLF
jgi:hypothetical protein